MADTMRLNNVDCDVVYVDPGASGSNDGSTPSDALTGLPDPDTWTTETVYLCRRGTSDLTFAAGTVSVDHVYLIGMPKSGDLFYDVAPAAAKSAWDSDVADYANVAANGAITVTINQNYNGFFGIDFKQNGNSSAYDLINVSNTNNYCHFLIYCRFRNPSYDLTSTSSASTVFTGSIYLYGNYAVIERCHFERQGRNADVTNGSDQFMIEFKGDYCSLIDSDLWVQSTGYDSSFSLGPGAVYFDGGKRHTISNVNINIVENQPNLNDSCFNDIFKMRQCDDTQINDLDIVFDREITTASTNRYFGALLDLDFNDRSLFNIQNVNIDMSNMSYDWGTSGASYLYISCLAFSSAKSSMESLIKNISIVRPQSFYVNTQEKVTLLLKSTVVVEDCTFDAGEHFVRIDATDVADENGCRMSNVSIVGPCEISNVPFADITSLELLTIPTSTAYHPLYAEASNVHVGTMTLPGSWTNDDTVVMQYESNVFIDTLDGPLFYSHDTPASYEFSLYANNINNLTGKWEGHNYRFHAITSAAFRTNGANASLKFTADASYEYPLVIGKRPFPGLKLSPSSTGDKTVTVYVAHKLFTTAQDLLKYFVVLVNSPHTATSGVYKEYNSSIYGNWQDDTSVWNNDDGLTVKRCEIPIKVDRLDDVEITIAYNWYENTGGYLYLDPQIDLS